MEIALNYSFIAWTALLAFLAKRNANLSLLLVVMMIPKLLDLILLTPSLQYIKHSDSRYLFFVVHGLNDVLMISLIYYRWLVSTILFKQSLFRRLTIEWYVIGLFSLSVTYNIAMVGEYQKLWSTMFNAPSQFFYDYYTAFKQGLLAIEAAILTALTVQTLKAVHELKKHGLIK